MCLLGNGFLCYGYGAADRAFFTLCFTGFRAGGGYRLKGGKLMSFGGNDILCYGNLAAVRTLFTLGFACLSAGSGYCLKGSNIFVIIRVK